MDYSEKQLKIIGAAMALEMYRLEHTDFVSVDEACALLGCKKSTLYKKRLPHNQYGWSKKAIFNELNK